MMRKKSQGKGPAFGLSGDPLVWLESIQDVQRIMADGVNPDGTLKPETIRALLKFRGVDIRSIARERGVSPSFVHQVIVRKRHDQAIEDAIAICLQMGANRIWGRPEVGK